MNNLPSLYRRHPLYPRGRFAKVTDYFNPSMLAAQWWMAAGVAPVAAWSAIGAASQSASYTDLTGNGYTLTLGTAPSWNASTGWTFNGTSQYLKTGVTTTSTAFTIIVRYTGGSTSSGTRVLAGSASSSPTRFFTLYQCNSSDGLRYYAYGANANAGGTVAASGVMALAGGQGYWNGSAEGTPTNPSTYPSRQIYIGARDDGSPLWYFSGAIRSVAIWNSTLNASQVAAISSAIP